MPDVPTSLRRDRLFAVQIAFMMLAGLASIVIPPAQGAMMLVPLTPAAAQIVAHLSTSGDTKLVGRGPLPRSLVVVANRAQLLGKATASAILVVAAPLASCRNL